MIIGGIEGTDANGKPINQIGVWTDKGFVETPIEKLFPPLKKKMSIPYKLNGKNISFLSTLGGKRIRCFITADYGNTCVTNSHAMITVIWSKKELRKKLKEVGYRTDLKYSPSW